MRVWLPKLPRKAVYPLGGVLLSLIMAAGFLPLRMAVGRAAPTVSGIAAELRSECAAYAYIALSTMSTMLALGWVLGRRQDRLQTTSLTDPLTGLANRRYLEERFGEELDRAERYGTSLSLLLIDVDALKAINDHQGHKAGDRAIGDVAEALRGTCRTTDLAARWGGDEFAVVAPSTTAAQALALADRIRDAVRQISRAKAPEAPPVSVSIGVTDLERSGTFRPETLINAADRALYLAKQRGRDRAVVAAISALRDAVAPLRTTG